MKTKIEDLRVKRKALIDQSRALLDKEDYSPEDQEAVERIHSDVKTIERQYTTLERQAGYDVSDSLSRGRQVPAGESDHLDSAESEIRANTRQPNGEAYTRGFDDFLRTGKKEFTRDQLRALQVGTNSEGGYLVPDEFYNGIVAGLNNENVMRPLSTVINTSNGTLEIPVQSSQGSAAWTAEEAAFNDSDDAFGQATLSAYKLTRIVKVSDELVQDSAFDLGSYLQTEFARSLGAAEEAAFVAGDGSSKPTGIVGSSGLGKTAAGAAAITTDELMDLFHSLGRSYRNRATFMMADATALAIRKLKDGDTQYMWQPGLQAGQPDRLLGRPVVISDSMPAMTTGLKSILFADFSYYWVGDRTATAVQRLDELYAATGQVGYRAYKRVDGKLTLAAAAKHLIQA